MQVLHLSEEQARQIVREWVTLVPQETSCYRSEVLGQLIREIECAFGIVWREDKRAFIRGL